MKTPTHLSLIVVFGPLIVINAQFLAVKGGFNGNQVQEWDVSGCSNINPIVDIQTIIQATAQTNPNKHCAAIRSNLKISDGFGYTITVQTLVVAGTPFSCPSPSVGKPGGRVGLIFNFFDNDNYHFVYKDLCTGNLFRGQKTSGVIGAAIQFATGSSVFSYDWIRWSLRVRRSNGQVSVSTSGGGYKTASGSFTIPTNTIKGQGGTLVVDGTSTTTQFWGFSLSPYGF